MVTELTNEPLGHTPEGPYLKALCLQRNLTSRTFRSEEALLRALFFRDDGDRVLEIGCGAGRPAFQVAPSVGLYVGVDINPHMIELAKVRCKYLLNVFFLLQDGTNLGFRDSVFDSVVCTYNTIGLLKPEERYDVISEAFRVLGPNGSLVLVGWRQGKDTNEAMKLHYARIGDPVIEITNEYVITQTGCYGRASAEELTRLVGKAGKAIGVEAGVAEIDIVPESPRKRDVSLWTAVIAIKHK